MTTKILLLVIIICETTFSQGDVHLQDNKAISILPDNREVIDINVWKMHQGDKSIACIETLKGSEDFLSQNSIDLLLLDLNLNGDDGFQLLKLAVSGCFQTIVVSANTDRALAAFEYGVLDFVPKPVESFRLWKAFERLSHFSDSRDHTKFLALRFYGSIELIPVSDILYLKGADDYAELHCRNGAMHLHSKSLESLEKYCRPDLFEFTNPTLLTKTLFCVFLSRVAVNTKSSLLIKKSSP
jgi:two-component system, LytTR family, response regulator LytT